jgi:hypothetical protein
VRRLDTDRSATTMTDFMTRRTERLQAGDHGSSLRK